MTPISRRSFLKEAAATSLLLAHSPLARSAPKADLDERKALALMQAQPSMIKRPVLELGGGKLLVGFRPADYAKLLNVSN